MKRIATRSMWIRMNNVESDLDRKLDRVTVPALKTPHGEVVAAQQVAAKKGRTWSFIGGRLAVQS